MVNHLRREKKILVLKALVEGNSIRATERIVGVHRDTIMRLGLRAGQAASQYMDRTMRGLYCDHIQIDEIWAFIGKKQANVTAKDAGQIVGTVFTHVAMDTHTKLVPTYYMGGRDSETAVRFLKDLAGRLANRIQLSSDGAPEYYNAALAAFGEGVDYGQVVKCYEAEPRWQSSYSLPKVKDNKRARVLGSPARHKICTSHIERQNLTIRTFVRRMTRRTNAFSKRYKNFEAAMSLHFLHYNYVRLHSTLKTVPAVAAGLVGKPWTIEELLEITDEK